MKLTKKQKTAISKKLLKGAKGTALAKEYGVANSTITKIKQDAITSIVSEVPAKKSVRKAIKKVVKVTRVPNIEVLATTREVIIYSPKMAGTKFVVKATTFGELTLEIGERDEVEAIFKDEEGNNHLLVNNDHVLPFTDGQPLNLYLVPVKVDAGCKS